MQAFKRASGSIHPYINLIYIYIIYSLFKPPLLEVHARCKNMYQIEVPPGRTKQALNNQTSKKIRKINLSGLPMSQIEVLLPMISS